MQADFEAKIAALQGNIDGAGDDEQKQAAIVEEA